MLKLIKIICLILVFITLYSCENITNTDSNVMTKLNIKDNQETNVIMPLKIGSKWYYKVTEYYSNRTIYKKYRDSIVVFGDTVIENGKWFKVYSPMLGKLEYVLLTNGDLGLWCFSPLGDNQTYLLAQYPDTNTFTNSKFWFSAQTSYGDWFQDSCIKYVKCEKSTAPIGQFANSNKYTQWLKFTSNGRLYNPFRVYNFVPEYGIIKFDMMFLNLGDSTASPLLYIQYLLE